MRPILAHSLIVNDHLIVLSARFTDVSLTVIFTILRFLLNLHPFAFPCFLQDFPVCFVWGQFNMPIINRGG
jgi:hypothetical protein